MAAMDCNTRPDRGMSSDRRRAGASSGALGFLTPPDMADTLRARDRLRSETTTLPAYLH